MNSSHLLCLIYFNRDLVEQLSLFIFKLASSTFSLESLFLIAIFTSATKISLCNSFRQRQLFLSMFCSCWFIGMQLAAVRSGAA